MQCLAKNSKEERCRNKGKWKKFFFCKDHNLFKSNWYFLNKLQWLRLPIGLTITGLLFILYAILNWEIEEYWSKSNFRKNVNTNKVTEHKFNVAFSNKNNFKVLLMPFGTSHTCDSETILCERELKKILVENENESDIEVLIDSSVTNKELIFTKKNLEEISQASKADLIIWGDYTRKCDFDSTLVQINYYMPNNSKIELLNINKYNLSSYQSFSNLSEMKNGKIIGDIKNAYNWIIGFQAFEIGNYEKSINYFKKVKKTKVYDYAPLEHMIGLCYQQKGALNEAIKYYTKALALDKDYYLSLNNRGNCYVNLGQFNEGLKDFNEAIKITSSNYPDLYLNRGILYRNKPGNYDYFTIRDFNMALDIWYKNKVSIATHSLILANRGIWLCDDCYTSEGLKDIQMGLKYDSNNKLLFFGKIICLIKDNKFAIANELLDNFIIENPNNQYSKALKINLLEKTYKNQEAENLKTSLRTNMGIPDNVNAYFDILGYKINI